MARSENVILTNMRLIYDGENILVQERTKKTWPGITFPGGHLEKDESIVESTIREIKEETNLDIKNPKLCGVSHWTNLCGARYITFCFKCNEFFGELKSSSEGKVFWIKKSELNNYPLAEDLLEMFRVIDDDLVSEFYSLRDKNEKEVLRKIL